MTNRNECRKFVKQIGKVRNVLWKISISIQETQKCRWYYPPSKWQKVRSLSVTDKDIGPCIVHEINHESGIKWIGSVTDLRFGKLNLSTQAGYRLTFSTEGNAVGKVVRWLGDVGRLIEVGTPIGITRRDIAKHRIIRFYYCVSQYQRVLKTERYVSVRVVSLLTLINFYQGVNHEVILKYGDGDISESSWVSARSKDELARGRTTTFTIHDTKPMKKLWN